LVCLQGNGSDVMQDMLNVARRQIHTPTPASSVP